MTKLTKSEIDYAQGAAEDFAKPENEMSSAARKSLEKGKGLGKMLDTYFGRVTSKTLDRIDAGFWAMFWPIAIMCFFAKAILWVLIPIMIFHILFSLSRHLYFHR